MRGRIKIAQFSFTNRAETLTTIEASLILFLKQQKAININSPITIDITPKIIAAVRLSLIMKFDDS